MKEIVEIGFIYTASVIRADGSIKDIETVHNILPHEGRDYILGAALAGAGQTSSWYIGLYGNDYEPVRTDSLTLFLAEARELTSYDTTNGSRLALAPDALSGGVYSNISTPAEFTFPAGETARGGFIASSQYQGSDSGIFLSAALFPSPKIADAGETIRVVAGLQLVT